MEEQYRTQDLKSNRSVKNHAKIVVTKQMYNIDISVFIYPILQLQVVNYDDHYFFSYMGARK